MATQARVQSTEALESFRAGLVIFMGKARRAIDEMNDEVKRTRSWLQHDQMTAWEGEIRRRTKLLNQAEQELRSAQLTGRQDSALMLRQAAVRREQQALAHAETRIRMVKKWVQNFDNVTDPSVKRLEGLRQVIEMEMPKAIAYLRQAQDTLEAYSDSPAPAPEAAPTAESS